MATECKSHKIKVLWMHGCNVFVGSLFCVRKGLLLSSGE